MGNNVKTFVIYFILLTIPVYSQTELIVNGGFEISSGSQTATPWIFTSNSPGFYIGSWNPHSGNNYAYVGANANGDAITNANGVLYQIVFIPNGVTSVTLNFWLKITTTETSTTTVYDFMGVYFGGSGSALLGFSNLSTKGVYEQKSIEINVAQYQGQYANLTFSEVSDGSKPTVFRVDDVSLTYVAPQLGKVNVTINPSGAISAGAQWNLDGGSWQISGTTLNNVQTGNHQINYKSISDWTSPSSQSINVTANNTTSASGTYTQIQQYGLVNVTINPSAAVSAGAQWNLDGGSWQNSGTTLNNVQTGNHQINYKSVSGWTSPSGQSINVTANNTTSISGTYTQIEQFGSVKVTINPSAAVSAGAQWKLENGSWQNSGATLTNIATGGYNVYFNSLSGWTSPNTQSINVVANSTTSFSGTYTQQNNLSVRIDSVMVTQTTIDQIGTGNVKRMRFNLNQTQIDVRERQEIHFVCTVLDEIIDVSSSSQIDWYSGEIKIGSGKDIKLTSLSAGTNHINVSASYQSKTANATMSNAIKIIPYPEIHFPFIGTWQTGSPDINGSGNYYNYDSHTGRFALDINKGSGIADWGLPVLAPISGKIKRPVPNSSVNTVWIYSNNPSGYKVIIYHMSAVFVESDSVINRGQLIGLCGGKDGYSPHIHFEMTDENNESKTIPPEPIFNGNSNIVQQIGKNENLVGEVLMTSDGLTYISEKNAQIVGSNQSSGILGFNNAGILSLSSQTMASYSLGNFNAGDKLTQISFFVPFSNGKELGITTTNVPIPPQFASATLRFANNVVRGPYNINPTIKINSVIKPQGVFFDVPFSFVLPQDGSVSLELQGDKLVYDEIRFRRKSAGSGGDENETPRIIVTRAIHVLNQLIVDVYNPYSKNQTLSKIEIVQTTNGLDTLRFESQSINVALPADSLKTFTMPWVSLSDTVQVVVKIISSIGVSDIAYIDLSSVTGVSSTAQVPTAFGLKQNYPNPFNPTTTIEYDIPKSISVKITVYDVLGRQVAILVDDEKLAGSYKLEFNASGLSNGIYLYQLQTSEFTQTKKLILMK